MKSQGALRLVLGLLLLAALACNPVPNLSVVSTLSAAATSAAPALGTLGAVAASAEPGQTPGTPGPAATLAPTAVVPADSLLPARVAAGELTLDGVTVPGNGQDFYGPILLVQVTDPGTQDVLVTIPCGLIFEPDNSDYQRMMVVQPISTVVAAQGSATLKPYVICIDDGKHAPQSDATYHLGNMAAGDLLALAACACTHTLTVNTDLTQEFGLQVAVWHTSDPAFPTYLTDNPLGPLLKPMMPLFVGAANGWLTGCGLKTIS